MFSPFRVRYGDLRFNTICSTVMDDKGEFDWPRQLSPYAMMIPDMSTDKYRTHSIYSTQKEKEDHAIATHFKTVISQIAEYYDKKNHSHTSHQFSSHGERVFGDTHHSKKIDPSFRLMEVILSFGSTLHKAQIFDAKYFELFNILFGAPSISLEDISSFSIDQIHDHLHRCIEQAKRTQASFTCLKRKRRLQFFLEHHIADIKQGGSGSHDHSAEAASLSQIKGQLDMHLNASLATSLVQQNSADERRVAPSQLFVKKEYLIKEKLGNFSNDFLACYLALLNSLDREEKLENLFTNTLKVCDKPLFPRSGDEVIFELLKLYEQVCLKETLKLNLRYAILPTTVAILRWILGQYLRNPPALLSPSDPDIQTSFSIQGFSNTEVLNLCAQLSAQGFKAEQLLVLCFSSFEGRERTAWEHYAKLLTAESASSLVQNASMKHTVVSAGIPKEIVDLALAEHCISKGKHADAISYFLDSNHYNRALSIFLKTQLSSLCSDKSRQPFSYLPLFQQETHKIASTGRSRKIVDIISIYFQFNEFFESDEEVNPADLRKFISELISRLPSLATCSSEEVNCIRLIANDVFQKAAQWILGESGGETLGRNLLDDELLIRMNSNLVFKELLVIDSALAQNIIRLTC